MLSQVIFATLFAIGFGAVLLRTNALWALVGIHALINLGPALQDSSPRRAATSSSAASSSPPPVALYGLYLMRPRRE